MKRVLLIKLSSLGDIIHTLPAITELVKYYPDCKFTWLCEPAFAELPALHPAVDQVISLPLRAWAKAWRRPHKLFNTYQRELKPVLANVLAQTYDCIIDAQGLLKTGILASLLSRKLKIPAHGYNFSSVREPVASWFYQQTHAVSRQEHALTRIRLLFAAAAGYSLPAEQLVKAVDYGLLASAAETSRRIALLHGTTWASKHWPRDFWLELAQKLVAAGWQPELTWYTEEQKARAQALHAACPQLQIRERMDLKQAVAWLGSCRAVVGLDTGFTHLADALAVPTVALFGPSAENLVGPRGRYSVVLSAAEGQFKCQPCRKRICSQLPVSERQDDELGSACLRALAVTEVFQALTALLDKSSDRDSDLLGLDN